MRGFPNWRQRRNRSFLPNRFKGALLGAALAVLIGAVMLGVHYYRHRFVRSNSDLLALLPGGAAATTFFADVDLLRRAGTLKLLEGTTVQRDPDYENFVRQSGFNYGQDLDAVAGAVKGNQTFLLLRGRFHWSQLRRYAAANGGTCAGDLCKVPAPKTKRWAGFLLVQPDVLGVSIAPDPNAVNQFKPFSGKSHTLLPEQPVWVSLSETLLKNPVDLAPPLRFFAATLQNSHPVVLSLDAAAEGSGSAFKLQLDAACRDTTTAETVRNRWELQTKMLKLELRRERRQANPADLTGLLTAGSFQAAGRRFIGIWPVRTELLQALQ